MRAPLLCLLVLGTAVAAPVPKGMKKMSDAQLVEGWWEYVTMDDGRGPTPIRDKDLIRDGALHHTGTLRNGDAGQPIRLDPTATPKEFDVEVLPGKVSLGIYQLLGDTLTTCSAKPGDPRPTEFAGGGGTVYCCVYKRAEAK